MTDENENLLEYENIIEPDKPNGTSHANGSSSTQTSSFRDFGLKKEILRAIGDSGFEHPSEVQQKCIPYAITGKDIICQAKSGMGKTAVFVFASLQQIEACEGLDTLVLCPSRELAFQIGLEYDRFVKYFNDIKSMSVFGGVPEKTHTDLIRSQNPQILVGTPGRIIAFAKNGVIKLSGIKRFILDECDRMLLSIPIRKDVQAIFKRTPREKQVLMFSATMDKATRRTCQKFTRQAQEIYVDDESKLTLHGLRQFYVELLEGDKTKRLCQLLDKLDFNQIVIFVKTVPRSKELSRLLNSCGFPSFSMCAGMKQNQRIELYKNFKENKWRILVTTDIFARGVDIARVNVVINYDMPVDSDMYLHRVGRAGRFGTQGLTISLISNDEDVKILKEVQKRFEVKVSILPDLMDNILSSKTV